MVSDRGCRDLFRDGDIDAVVRKAISRGLEPVRAITLATLNTAEYFGLKNLGAIAPGYTANLIVISDLSSLEIDMVFYRGHLVAEQGKPLFSLKRPSSKRPTGTINIKPFNIEALRLMAKAETKPVIEVVPGQIITRKRLERVKVSGDIIVPDISPDILSRVLVGRECWCGDS